MKAIDVLTAADKLLSSEKAFSINSFARDKSDARVNPCDDKAVKWCLAGACRKVTDDPMVNRETEHKNMKPYTKAILTLNKLVAPRSLVHFNDTRGYLEVKKLLKTAIKQLA